MKIKTNNLIFSLLTIGVFLVLAYSCKEEEASLSSNPTNGKTTAVFNPQIRYGTVTDQDGNVYKTVQIDNVTWMAENLRTTKYNDGTPIPLVTDFKNWSSLTTGAYCNYNNTSNIDTIATYGRLYNWHAVNTGMLAPKGWHVPTDAEWKQLTDYLGGESVAGGKLKELGTTHWSSPNAIATNSTGFTALPGGRCVYNGTFSDFGRLGLWWSSTQESRYYAFFRSMRYSGNEVSRQYDDKVVGFSVRCVKD